MSRLLIAGSYPPVPGPASSATVAAVRRAWADGHEAMVVSPRPSAAHYIAPLVGIEASWALYRLRPRLQADGLVLCMEPGMPFTSDAGAARHRLEAQLLAQVIKGYPTVSVVVTGDLGLAPTALAPLWAQVDEVIAASNAEAETLQPRLGCPPALIRVDAGGTNGWNSGGAYGRESDPNAAENDIRTRAAHLRESREPTGMVTPTGPMDWDERPRRLANLAYRKVFGRYADPLRGRVAHLYRLAKR